MLRCSRFFTSSRKGFQQRAQKQMKREAPVLPLAVVLPARSRQQSAPGAVQQLSQGRLSLPLPPVSPLLCPPSSLPFLTRACILLIRSLINPIFENMPH